MRSLVFAVALALSGAFGRAQAPSAATSTPIREAADAPASKVSVPENPAAELPVVKLDFKDQPPIPGVSAASVVSSPVLCSSDGTPFVDFPQLPYFMDHVVYSLDPKGARSFSPKSVPGLYDVAFQSYFAGDSSVVFLVRATKDDKQSEKAENPLPGIPAQPVRRYIGKHQDYVVTFDRDGNYKSTAELSSQYDFWRIGVLPDGNLLALAFVRGNSVARLMLLDSGGRVLRTLQIPSKMEDSPDLRQGESGPDINQSKAESSLSWWLFSSSRNRILLYQAHTSHPVLEVGAGGAAREVQLEVPKGYAVDGFVPANDRWIVRYARDSAFAGRAADASTESKNLVLYEVDPADGSLRRRIDPGAGSFFDIACEQDAVFTAFSMKEDKVVRRTAEAPR